MTAYSRLRLPQQHIRLRRLSQREMVVIAMTYQFSRFHRRKLISYPKFGGDPKSGGYPPRGGSFLPPFWGPGGPFWGPGGPFWGPGGPKPQKRLPQSGPGGQNAQKRLCFCRSLGPKTQFWVKNDEIFTFSLSRQAKSLKSDIFYIESRSFFQEFQVAPNRGVPFWGGYPQKGVQVAGRTLWFYIQSRCALA